MKYSGEVDRGWCLLEQRRLSGEILVGESMVESFGRKTHGFFNENIDFSADPSLKEMEGDRVVLCRVDS